MGMKSPKNKPQPGRPPSPLKALLPFIAPHKRWIVLLILLGGITSAGALIIPKTLGTAIDEYSTGAFNANHTLTFLIGVTVVALIAAIIQQIVSTTVTERLAMSIRTALSRSISQQSFQYIQQQSAAKLLTNFTSDIDEVKVIISQGLVTILSAFVMIIGSGVLLFTINVKLALIALIPIPILFVVFQMVMRKIRSLFGEARSNTDALNRVITESITGAAIVRILNGAEALHARFDTANSNARRIGMKLLAAFGSFFPLLNTLSSASIVIAIWYGGNLVIGSSMTLGDFTAFYSYLNALILPIFILGFVSNIFVQATVAFGRMHAVLTATPPKETGSTTVQHEGEITYAGVSLTLHDNPVLSDVSLNIPFGKYTAIVGPTAAGKTQLLYTLLGLVAVDAGDITLGGVSQQDADRGAFLADTGIVFQDHVVFQASIRENITLGRTCTDEQITRALEIADLAGFVDTLPNGIDTVISERGSNMSGGQKQRISLARAIVTEPKLLVLDDFTARVDNATNARIRENLTKHLPNHTRIEVTQTIESIRDADHIILLMEGEVLAEGTHEELLARCFEYQQIAQSQETTHV